MTAAKPTHPDDLRMSAEEFDRIMGKALQVKLQDTPKAKPATKSRAVSRKRRPTK
jgi:hypothetical protein